MAKVETYIEVKLTMSLQEARALETELGERQSGPATAIYMALADELEKVKDIQ